MAVTLNILIIEDIPADFLMVERHLRQQGLNATCSRVDSLEGLNLALDSSAWDLVLSDYSIPRLNFTESFDYIQSRFPDLPVILVSGSIGEEQAVELLKLGVWDFVLKDHLTRLVPAIERSLRELSERKALLAAEESRRESEGMYRSLFENMLNGFALCRMIFDVTTPLDFIYLSVNDAFEKQTGLKDVVGRRVSEVIPGVRESDPMLFDIYGRVALTGKPEQFETYVEALEQWYWISVYSPAREHFVAVFDVISDRKRNEQSLRESEERFRMIFEHSIDAIMLTRTDGSILAANPEACRVFDMCETEICRSGRDGLVDADDGRVFPLMEERKRTGRCRGEITMKRGDGSRFPAEISSAVFTDQEGCQKTSLVIRDVTERKSLEKQFLQAQKMEAVGRLAGGVAHDFNNMLNVILGYAELAMSRLVPADPTYRNLQEIRKAGERSAALTKQLLAFARKEASVPAVINVNTVIADQLKMLRRRHQDRI